MFLKYYRDEESRRVRWVGPATRAGNSEIRTKILLKKDTIRDVFCDPDIEDIDIDIEDTDIDIEDIDIDIDN
jgi:hypothetical protein